MFKILVPSNFYLVILKGDEPNNLINLKHKLCINKVQQKYGCST